MECRIGPGRDDDGERAECGHDREPDVGPRGGQSERCRVTQVSAAEAGDVLQEYIALEPITRRFFRATAQDPTWAFAEEAEMHPVLRLLPE